MTVTRLKTPLCACISLALLAAGCGGHGQTARQLSRANAVCRRDDAQIASSESLVSGGYSEATVQLIESEVADLQQLHLDAELTKSFVRVDDALSALQSGPGTGVGTIDLLAARRAGYAVGIHCSFGAPGTPP